VVIEANTPTPSGLDSSYYLCPGDTLNISLKGDSFIWSPNVFISDTTISNPLIYPPANQNYQLIYFDTNGCEGNDTTLIVVNGVIPTLAGPDQLICDGDSITLGGNPTGPIGTTFSWSPALNMNNITLSNPTVLPIANTTYTVITTNDTCKGTDQISVILQPLPILTTSADTFVCIGDSIQISANGIGAFSWNNGNTLSDSTISNPIAFPTAPTWYTVRLSDVNSCSAIDSVFVDLKSLPIADAGNTIEACKFSPTPIGGNPTGPIGSSYLWTPSSGLNFNGLANPLVTINKDASYIVQVTDSFGCIGLDSVQISVFRASDQTDTTHCDSINVVLAPILTHGTSPFTYSWEPSNLFNDPTSPSPIITVGQSNIYSVTITDDKNCKDTLVYTINSLQATQAAFSYDLIPTCQGIGIKLINESMGATSYEWMINSTTVSTEFEPTLIFNYGSSVNIMLATTSIDGCKDRTADSIQGTSFEDLLEVEIGNIFTPNGDGVNDFFEIAVNGELANCIDLNIFNRDGTTVYQSQGGIHSWDGRSSVGKKFPDGVYFYVLSINGFEYKGNITLLNQ
jgi:gliding motility-associated-like protein